MRGLPLCAGAIIIVRVHVVIVHVHPGQKRRPRRTAHRRRDVRVPKLRPLVPYGPQRLRHEVQRAKLHVLVVSQDKHYVRLTLPGGRHRRQDGRLAAAADALLGGEHVGGDRGAKTGGEEDGEERVDMHF